MDAARDAYASINPDSPWRWAAIWFIPPLLVALELTFRLSYLGEYLGLFAAFVAGGVVFAILRWIGPFAAYDAAIKHIRQFGGQRVVTRSVLAWGLITLGSLMIVTPVVADWFRPLFFGAPWSWITNPISVPMIGLYLVIVGLIRPCDLRVVERETTPASEVTT